MYKNAETVSREFFLECYYSDRDPICHDDYIGLKDGYHYIASYDPGLGSFPKYRRSFRIHQSELPADFPDKPQKPIRSSNLALYENATTVSKELFLKHYFSERDDIYYSEYLGPENGYHYIAIYDPGPGDCTCFQKSIRIHESELPANFFDEPPKPCSPTTKEMFDNAVTVTKDVFMEEYYLERNPKGHNVLLGSRDGYLHLAIYRPVEGDRPSYQGTIRIQLSKLPASFPNIPKPDKHPLDNPTEESDQSNQ